MQLLICHQIASNTNNWFGSSIRLCQPGQLPHLQGVLWEGIRHHAVFVNQGGGASARQQHRTQSLKTMRLAVRPHLFHHWRRLEGSNGGPKSESERFYEAEEEFWSSVWWGSEEKEESGSKECEEEEESRETMRAEPDVGPHLPLQHISSGS